MAAKDVLLLDDFQSTEDVHVMLDETPDNECFLVTEPGLEDYLYNVYSNVETSKELWIALERKYKIEDVGLKKFIAAKFLDYTMVDSKSVITQVQELKVIDEAFQVAVMIEKLSPLWKDFKNYLKHKRKEMSLENLIVRLRIEEDNKAARKKGRENSTIMGANIVEDTPQNNRKRKKTSGPKSNQRKKRFNGNCYNCGKAGHKSADCRAPKKDKKKGQANMVEKHEAVDDLCVMLSKCNLVGNHKE
ncbi:uncharacterized protein [Nicotiana sylvestris]|uniref:uncharacterized protein n=1 Tax=Nicotiana sylvestris TaxID=4096 RepID=UPI00388C42D4